MGFISREYLNPHGIMLMIVECDSFTDQFNRCLIGPSHKRYAPVLVHLPVYPLPEIIFQILWRLPYEMDMINISFKRRHLCACVFSFMILSIYPLTELVVYFTKACCSRHCREKLHPNCPKPSLYFSPSFRLIWF